MLKYGVETGGRIVYRTNIKRNANKKAISLWRKKPRMVFVVRFKYDSQDGSLLKFDEGCINKPGYATGIASPR